VTAYRIEAPYDGNAAHLYLVQGARLALIDSGAADSPSAAVEPALRELGLKWDDLDYLLNTHGHLDDTGGDGELTRPPPVLETLEGTVTVARSVEVGRPCWANVA
jgi:glyoxylase-like metal-dependent hydrolase (beta-lactamase superfamily II)